ncbi:14987_t:CDS:2, partial [Acaulospora colombiana]
DKSDGAHPQVYAQQQGYSTAYSTPFPFKSSAKDSPPHIFDYDSWSNQTKVLSFPRSRLSCRSAPADVLLRSTSDYTNTHMDRIAIPTK